MVTYRFIWRTEVNGDYFEQQFKGYESKEEAVQAWSDVWNLDPQQRLCAVSN